MNLLYLGEGRGSVEGRGGYRSLLVGQICAGIVHFLLKARNLVER